MPTRSRLTERTAKERTGEPIESAVKAAKVEQSYTPEEKARIEKLRVAIADAVLEFPEMDGSHRVRFDGFYDIPSATVLERVVPELIPEVHILERGDLGKHGAKVGPGLPAGVQWR